jgi:hypothetical protein
MKFDVFFAIIMAIETGGHPSPNHAKGDAGELGCVQITKICVDDINRIIGHKEYDYKDRTCPIKSKYMMRVYLDHWGSRYERLTGKEATDGILARIWNGGANGWKSQSTIRYLEKYKRYKARHLEGNLVH